jgi:hypothetical protein
MAALACAAAVLVAAIVTSSRVTTAMNPIAGAQATIDAV